MLVKYLFKILLSGNEEKAVWEQCVSVRTPTTALWKHLKEFYGLPDESELQ